MLNKIKKIHFIGIGGIGMSGLAELLARQGYIITGSDLQASDNTERLRRLGIAVQIGHRRENVPGCDLAVYTSAATADNPELIAASEKGIPSIKRAQLLAEIVKLKSHSIAVSGTHGKTTTTSLLGHVFQSAGRKPTVIMGGISKNIQSNIQSDDGDIIIVEADEFDHSFLYLHPTHEIITSLEAEHLDVYRDLTDLQNSFLDFINRIPSHGLLVVCVDDPNIRNILPDIKVTTTTYGIHQPADINARHIELERTCSRFSVFQRDQSLGSVELSIPGLHNVQNALGAIAMSLAFEIPFKIIAPALKSFQGMERRFDIRYQDENYILIDDYAHHPSEISATLGAAQEGWQRRIIVLFQPHLFSRTRVFFKEFALALAKADIVYLLDIYPAREQPIEGVSSRLILDAAREQDYKNFYYFSDYDQLFAHLRKTIRPGDMIITLGAGDIFKLQKRIRELINVSD